MKAALIATLALASGCAEHLEAQSLGREVKADLPAVEVEPEPEAEPEPEPVLSIPASKAIPVRQMLARMNPAPALPSPDLPEPDPALVEAIRREISIPLPNGEHAPVRHCRSAGPRMEGAERWDRCERRIRLFTSYFQAAGERHGVDPWLLAAMARRESGFHPMAQGSIGEFGIMQLHPQGVGRRSRYVQNARYRERCQRVPGACQEEVVDLGASLIGRAIQRCGDEASALGAYNRGECGETDYSRRVMRTLQRMRGMDAD